MPRNIPVGNGEMLVAFDDQYRMRDLYWPHVGQPNHTCGHMQRFGVWADGQFAWIDSPGWTRDLRYKPDTMVTEVRLRHDRLGIELLCNDAVDYWSPVYFRRVVVTDLLGKPRDVRVFFHHDISVNETPVGDTVMYDPQSSGLVHYKDAAYFLLNGCSSGRFGIDYWATGAKRIGDAEGTWRDAEDGLLSRHAIAQGSVDSTIGFSVALSAWGSGSLHCWLAAGRTHEAVLALNEKVRTKTPQRMMDRTEAYWRLWALKEPLDLSPLPERLRDMFVRSQVICRTQIDNNGAIIAANDYDITHFAGDTYSYMWPRDGALVSHALVLAGHGELSRNFFRFCEKVITKDGYFLHKYNPTGTLASSWHPSILEGERVLPIQQDETSLVIWSLRRHFQVFRDVEFIKGAYDSLVVQPANWILRYRDHNGLPQPSWDLWEERRGVHLFTVASTIGALKAAASFAQDMGAYDRASEYNEGAERMRGAMIRHMWEPERGRFARMATPLADGTYRVRSVCIRCAQRQRPEGGRANGSGARTTVGQDAHRRHRAVRERLLPPHRAFQSHRRARKPVGDLHIVGRAVAHRTRGDGQRTRASVALSPLDRRSRVPLGSARGTVRSLHRRCDFGESAHLVARNRDDRDDQVFAQARATHGTSIGKSRRARGAEVAW